MAGLGRIRLFLLEKYKKEKLGHILEKKCREAHPSKKSMDIPTFQVIQSGFHVNSINFAVSSEEPLHVRLTRVEIQVSTENRFHFFLPKLRNPFARDLVGGREGLR